MACRRPPKYCLSRSPVPLGGGVNQGEMPAQHLACAGREHPTPVDLRPPVVGGNHGRASRSPQRAWR
eukprot:7206736-Lingulodinium_polyedra.AAC.1